MPISYSERARLTCPACLAPFDADVWILVEAAERPDLAQALRDGALNTVACPHCGHEGPAGAPLLFHDASSRRVYFAVPADVEEHAWRERAQSLLYLLVGSIPEEERRPYLGDVQVEHEVDGVRRAILRRERHRRPAEPKGAIQPEPEPVRREAPASPAPAAAPDDQTTLLEAVRALVSADSAAQFEAIVAMHPQLLTDEGDSIVHQLAELAYNEGQRDVAAALREVRATLAQLRAGRPVPGDRQPAPGDPAAASAAAPAPESVEPPTQDASLSDAAYQALLHAASPDDLAAAARDYPALLEEWADAELAARADAALDEGNERLARVVEMHRETLAELRARVGGQDMLLQAVRALLEADGEDAIADVIAENPILLTDAAQDALFGLAAGARAQGDQDLAEYAISCRAMLRTVRAGLDEPTP
ncbi:MAG: hypothetical protein IPO81_04155 [Kouleothrix sp.]|nr:hypothetical protein [Kouleothrix sp.]